MPQGCSGLPAARQTQEPPTPPALGKGSRQLIGGRRAGFGAIRDARHPAAGRAARYDLPRGRP